MKIILIALLLLSSNLYGATCTSISRTNAAANSVLTSSKYNNDLNNILTFVNTFDGGCVQDGTLESTSLDATQFKTPLRAIKAGCKVGYSDSNTLTISPCYAAVNGNWVSTASATTVTWSCTGCSSEATGTTYYAYAANGSSGSSLTGKILTTAPNDDGYNSGGDRALARFYNNTLGNIDPTAIDQFIDNRFVPNNTTWTDGGVIHIRGGVKGTIAKDKFYWRRQGANMDIRYDYRHTTAGTAGAQDYQLWTVATGTTQAYWIDTTDLVPYTTDEGGGGYVTTNAQGALSLGYTGGSPNVCSAVVYDTQSVRLACVNDSGQGFWGDGLAAFGNAGVFVQGTFSVPILGWGE